MVAKVVTVAFQGVEARRVDVEVTLTSGDTNFIVVGLGDKAVGESRERVRGAFAGLGLALPASAWRCRPSAWSATLRLQTCPRRAVTTTCRSPWRSWRPWASCRPTP